MKAIKRNEVHRVLRQGGHVINVLSNEQFLERHIPGSVNIPFNEGRFAEDVDERVGDMDAPVVVYCAGPSCDASSRAAAALEEAGFTDVRDYDGGMDDWVAANEPTETSRPATEQV